MKANRHKPKGEMKSKEGFIDYGDGTIDDREFHAEFLGENDSVELSPEAQKRNKKIYQRVLKKARATAAKKQGETSGGDNS